MKEKFPTLIWESPELLLEASGYGDGTAPG